MNGFDDVIESGLEELDKKRQQRHFEEKQKQFDTKLQNLADTVIDMENERGSDDEFVYLLNVFLEAALEMRAMMTSMKAVSEAMQCISEGISFMDDAIAFDHQLVMESTKHNYGFFARWKAKREMKKAMRNNVGRMLSVVDGLSMKQDLVTSMVDALKMAGIKFKRKSEKAAAKRQKKAERAKRNNPTSGNSSDAAQKFLAERRAERGLGGASSAGGAGAAPAGAAASSSGGPDLNGVV